MSFFTEYALLFAASLPVIAIVGMQAYLFVNGERGTLLVPGLGGYPSVESARKPVAVMPASTSASTPAESSNDEIEREAA